MNTIPLSAEMGERINEIMINYVKGGDRSLARGRCMDKPEVGGYGLIDANIMNTSIKASWLQVGGLKRVNGRTTHPLWLLELKS